MPKTKCQHPNEITTYFPFRLMRLGHGIWRVPIKKNMHLTRRTSDIFAVHVFRKKLSFQLRLFLIEHDMLILLVN